MKKMTLLKLAAVALVLVFGLSMAPAEAGGFPPCEFACSEAPQNLCSSTKCSCFAMGGATTVCIYCADNNCLCGQGF